MKNLVLSAACGLEPSQINFDFEDEVIQSSVLAYDGKIMNERFA